MAVRSAGTPALPRIGRVPGELPVEILESKLYTPAIRPGVVPRPQLLVRLRAARNVPTVAVVAPAGYGKTTILALWAEADERPFAWLSLDADDNDPIVLLSHLAVALDRVSPLPLGTFDALRSSGASVPATVVPRVASAMAGIPQPLVLVLDDVHHLVDGPALDALVTLVGQLRGRVQIALAGRGMPVPLGRWRSQGLVVEIGVAGLVFPEDAARSLLRAAGADLPDEEVAALARRTEGWAAGLYLAALARTEAWPAAGTHLAGGEGALVTDYLESELLSRLPPQDLSFLTRTAVLDRLSGPLCDAVLEASGSAAELARLQRENLFLVPLDGRHEWYRYHQLFRDLLRARLERDGAGQIGELLRRAADWCESDGQLETALHYARDAGDTDRVARIAGRLAHPMYAAGRTATLMSWLEWAAGSGAEERHPAVAALAAYVCALTGRPAAADRWADLAERSTGSLATGDGDRSAMWLTTIRALMCRDGPQRMRRDADDADGIPRAGSATDQEYVMRLFLSGVAHLLLGDDDCAEARFTDAAELTDAAVRPPIFSAIVGYQALLHLRRGDWAATERLVGRALSVVHRGHAESHVTSVLVFALAAHVALHRSDPTLARAHLGRAQSLRPLLSHAIPWFAVEALLEMAEVAIGLGDLRGARLLAGEAEAVLRRRPRLGLLGERAKEFRGRLGTMDSGGAGTSTLTSAELRVLPLLLTHLTLAGIAERLSLSRHTVKSQVWSLYHKLGVHTRGDAVARARELGLLEA